MSWCDRRHFLAMTTVALAGFGTENESFGEAMLAARRSTVFDVSAMALGLAAYGDADWRLTLERPEGP